MKNRSPLIAITILFLLFGFTAAAQTGKNVCSMKSERNPILVDVEALQSNPQRSFVPYEVVEVFVHHVTCTGCAVPQGEADTLLARLNDARNLFSPHSICFLLVGSQNIYNSDLADQFVETEENELTPFLKPGVLNVFVHRILHQPGGINGGGWAYHIPNQFLSVESTALSADCCTGLLAHEFGHCLGLYHTHETWSGTKVENVDRTGTCKNCVANGDLLCDTPADPTLNAPGVLNNCNYISLQTDPCGDLYTPDPTNLMSYSGDDCQTQISTGQGLRSLNILNNNLPTIKAPEILLINQNATWTSGEFIQTAKTSVTYSAPSLLYSQAVIMWSAAGESITVMPGTTFSVTSGSARLSVQDVCQ